MYDLVTLKELRQHDYYGMIRKHCVECDDEFMPDSVIYHQEESNIYLCQRCYSEIH